MVANKRQSHVGEKVVSECRSSCRTSGSRVLPRPLELNGKKDRIIEKPVVKDPTCVISSCSIKLAAYSGVHSSAILRSVRCGLSSCCTLRRKWCVSLMLLVNSPSVDNLYRRVALDPESESSWQRPQNIGNGGLRSSSFGQARKERMCFSIMLTERGCKKINGAKGGSES